MSEDTTFRYSYSAAESKEIQAIRKKYLPKVESKFEELKRLDHYVQNAGMFPGLCVGVSGCLIFGLGMCLAMHVIGNSMALGVFLGICGAIAMIFAYPVSRSVFKTAEAKYKTRILELAAELGGEN